MYLETNSSSRLSSITHDGLLAQSSGGFLLGPVIRSVVANGQWGLALSLLFVSGERDETILTNSLFFARHPERGDRKLDPKEPGYKDLSKEWLVIRNDRVRPFLQKALAARGTATKPGAPSAPATAPGKNECVHANDCTSCERRIVNAPPPMLDSVPSELRTYPKKERWLDAAALTAYRRMVSEARRAGISSPYLTLVSGHRTYDEQANLWRKRLLEKFKSLGCPVGQHTCIRSAIDRTTAALRPLPLLHPKGAWLNRFLSELERSGCTPPCDPRTAVSRVSGGTAPPGRSPHHTGRAVDLHVGGRISTESDNVAFQRRQTAYKWLVCNAARFGFYPYAREPWHWEYNPPS